MSRVEKDEYGECQNCKFYNEKRSRCYRFPPQIGVETDKCGNTRAPSHWPSVHEDDYCGEFSVRNKVREQWTDEVE